MAFLSPTIGTEAAGWAVSLTPWVKDVLPVRVARSALGPNTPHADLYVTKEHALLINGVLVTAGSLINGTTITLYASLSGGSHSSARLGRSSRITTGIRTASISTSPIKRSL